MVLDVFYKNLEQKRNACKRRKLGCLFCTALHATGRLTFTTLKRNPALQQKVWDTMHEPHSADNADNQLLL